MFNRVNCLENGCTMPKMRVYRGTQKNNTTLEVCTGRFFRPGPGPLEKSPFICRPGPGRWKNHLSFAGPDRPVGKITFCLPARPFGKITSYLLARPGSLEQSSLICWPTRALGPTRARAYFFHNLL